MTSDRSRRPDWPSLAYFRHTFGIYLRAAIVGLIAALSASAVYSIVFPR